MKHCRSSAEQEIRDAVVTRARELWPDARIIHEMNVEGGSSRADVVAVQPEHLWIFEIKSERDTLSRLAGQIKDFGPCCHGLIVAAHEKWTAQEMVEVPARTNKAGWRIGGYQQQAPSKIMEAALNSERFETWTFPEPERSYGRSWEIPIQVQTPWHARMLRLLWADELREAAAFNGVSCTPRTPAYKLAPQMSQLMTGREIERAVCRALRRRSFAEADDPILERAP